jgi:16S rRNA (guanine527-N7)-methyltransferase
VDSNANLVSIIKARAAELDLDITDEVAPQLVRYWDLLCKWNRSFNLVGLPLGNAPVATIDRILMEPLRAASLLSRVPGMWIDLGSGGGSPAVPIKVVVPELALLMVESRQKKCVFLREVVQVLALSDATVLADRIERLPPTYTGSADLVSVRALKMEGAVPNRTHEVLKLGGRLMLFGTETVPNLSPGHFAHLSSTPMSLPNSVLHIFQKR